jgi:hypothetical protein
MLAHRLILVVVAAVVVDCHGVARGVAHGEPVSFGRDVRPVLAEKCFGCHGPDVADAKGGLRLDSRSGAVGSDGKGAIVPGEPDQSELVRRIRSTDESEQMPPPESHKTLSAAEIDTLVRWIDEGAEYTEHWAFQAPVRGSLPDVRAGGWVRNPIDAFVLAALEQRGMEPAPEADRETLVRRVSFDLRGLPPSLAEIDEFLADTASDAHERMVDRMLASPHYGEKMALIWNDLARHGDTSGFHNDSTRDTWPWRDWVIAACNDNMPYDRFSIEQLAGDLVPDATAAHKIASGFNRNVRFNEEGGADPDEWLVRYAVDRTVTLGRIWLGLTLNCAECHSHKYDPVSHKEFYSLYAFFNSLEEVGAGGMSGFHGKPVPPVMPVRLGGEEPHRAAVAAAEAEREAILRSLVYVDPGAEAHEPPAEQPPANDEGKPKVDPAHRSFAAWRAVAGGDESVPKELRGLLGRPAESLSAAGEEQLRRHYLQHVCVDTRGQFKAVHERLRSLQAVPLAQQPVSVELPEPRPAHVLTRGDFQQPAERVERDVPAVLPPLPDSVPRNRLTLARWLFDPAHPLTARVAVNRLWAQVFGRGIVETIGDFGRLGRYPSHPELLDWLAVEFRESGWDTKQLLRLLVTSSTYRQSAAGGERFAASDPGNVYLSRAPRFRLMAEEIRDAALQVSGQFVETVGGPPVYPVQPVGYYAGKSGWSWKESGGNERFRRGLYTFWRRTTPYPTFVIFDAPDRSECIVERPRTNTPLQALTTLNDPQFVEAARALARDLLASPGDDDLRLTLAFRRALSRPPTAEELIVVRGLLDRRRSHYTSHPDQARAMAGNDAGDPVAVAAWTNVANAILNLDEFIMRQ